MHFKNTQGRSPSRFKIQAMVAIALIFILWASPSVFSFTHGTINQNVAEAYDFKSSLTSLSSKVGLTTKSGEAQVSLPVFIGRIIYYALGFIGVIFLLLAILAGIRWMLAGGNEETVAKAKSSLLNAALGALVALSSYAITYFIVDKIIR